MSFWFLCDFFHEREVITLAEDSPKKPIKKRAKKPAKKVSKSTPKPIVDVVEAPIEEAVDEPIEEAEEESEEEAVEDYEEEAGEEPEEESKEEPLEEYEEETEETSALESNVLDDSTHLIHATEIAYTLGWRWADFQLYVISPDIPPITPPVIIPPEPLLEGTGLEFVYPIHDYGFKLATSKADDMVSAGMSMCKLFYTIEKMVYLLVERLKSGGISTETEVEVAFVGFVLAQRKGFESIVNLSYNVVVTNFEPGEWGDNYLETVKRLAEKGYGYPPESPRDSYRHLPSASTTRKP